MAGGPYLQLNNGHTIPQLAFGTFDAPKEVTVNAVKAAFDAGYRHIDCAMIYGNEKEVGQGIAESLKKHGLRREDIFITSKLWGDRHDPKVVRETCEESIRNLGLDYLDLYLIHWPVSYHNREGVQPDLNNPNTLVYEDHKLEDTWCAMEKLVSAGLVKSVGVSNFNKRQIEHIIKNGKIIPAVNQVEVNLHCLNTKLIEFCQSKNIVVEGYSPFGSPGFHKNLSNPILQLKAVTEVAKIHNRTPAQVIVRHGLQRDIVVIAKSVTVERIHSNYNVLDFELSEEEMDRLNQAGQNERLVKILGFAKHPEYPFHDEF
ncbi:hypothetical protein Aperf_G00000117062 [Anoplocephala perfoliata]